MIWQELIFTAGSVFGIFVLTPTLRDSMATVPLGTSAPSALIGLVYSVTFLTMGMTFSAAGAFATGTLWTLIAMLRSPTPPLLEAVVQTVPITLPRHLAGALGE